MTSSEICLNAYANIKTLVDKAFGYEIKNWVYENEHLLCDTVRKKLRRNKRRGVLKAIELIMERCPPSLEDVFDTQITGSIYYRVEYIGSY